MNGKYQNLYIIITSCMYILALHWLNWAAVSRCSVFFPTLGAVLAFILSAIGLCLALSMFLRFWGIRIYNSSHNPCSSAIFGAGILPFYIMLFWLVKLLKGQGFGWQGWMGLVSCAFCWLAGVWVRNYIREKENLESPIEYSVRELNTVPFLFLIETFLGALTISIYENPSSLIETGINFRYIAYIEWLLLLCIALLFIYLVHRLASCVGNVWIRLKGVSENDATLSLIPKIPTIIVTVMLILTAVLYQYLFNDKKNLGSIGFSLLVGCYAAWILMGLSLSKQLYGLSKVQHCSAFTGVIYCMLLGISVQLVFDKYGPISWMFIFTASALVLSIWVMFLMRKDSLATDGNDKLSNGIRANRLSWLGETMPYQIAGICFTVLTIGLIAIKNPAINQVLKELIVDNESAKTIFSALFGIVTFQYGQKVWEKRFIKKHSKSLYEY
ncbi:hypothetical protein OZX62_05225 [Bifidobacterium sp. ESL0690]|uniref:hypothetical protein n=1 Tax=Bifidobacterium sp. ESL0690 TaxID=2983214 RepID=UPI0023F83FA6|nr:hypothetical protein [Bifidobacterium sp. ESL0690]WEV47662.1 hypothetical protein OZX62_05225 [Bifidobacterium sp. ESL0690]